MDSSSAQDGGPAFPTLTKVGDVAVSEGGVTIRDFFAGMALAGILSGPASRDGVPLKEWFDVPEQAYKIADVMLAERAKGE